MSEFEPFVTCRAISIRSMGSYSEESVRAACHRGKAFHPLPHIKSGKKRPVLRIRWSDFEKWVDEETLLEVGID